jgi:XapX domain-containing protein
MRLLIGAMLAFLVGAGCRYFDIPAPCPAILPGAVLVFAMTIGYSTIDRALSKRAQFATTKDLCGGPTGKTTASAWNGKTDADRHIETTDHIGS